MTPVLIVAVLALLLSIGIRLLIGRRRFYRRNHSGLQTYSSYTRSLIVPFMERIFGLFAKALFLGGILLLFIWYMEQR